MEMWGILCSVHAKVPSLLVFLLWMSLKIAPTMATAEALAPERDAAAHDALVAELQDEFMADDLIPPQDATGWTAARLRAWFENGGVDEVEPPTATKATASTLPAGEHQVRVDFLVHCRVLEFPLSVLLHRLLSLSWNRTDLFFRGLRGVRGHRRSS